MAKLDNDISGIYLIKSKCKPKRIYIGSSKNIFRRWANHLSQLRHNAHYNKELQKHFNKYSESDLEFTIIIGCEKKELKIKEQFFIDCFDPYFNYFKVTGAGYRE